MYFPLVDFDLWIWTSNNQFLSNSFSKTFRRLTKQTTVKLKNSLAMLRMAVIASPRRFYLIFSLISVISSHKAAGYANTPELNRQAMAGIWRLTSRRSFLPKVETPPQQQQPKKPMAPMKEFTLYPIKVRAEPSSSAPAGEAKYEDLLLKLCEDGSFVQYASDVAFNHDDDDDGDNTIAESSILGEESEVMKGTWDFMDGKLILATDRPANADARKVHDTVFTGKVIAKEENLAPKSDSNDSNATISNKKSEAPTSSKDGERSRGNHMTILTVPKGKIKIGRFMYPKKHPSFFDEPIFDPTRTGSFELRQVLGNTPKSTNGWWDEQDDQVEKFKKKELFGKRFFLTSHPIGFTKKNKPRWSRSLKRYVEDPVPINENEKFNIRVMELELFSNSTFSTMAGLGSSTVLRGRWDIIGKERDQLWMQIWRFGFGRSVQGSTFSEGKGLTHNDEKTYWGHIRRQNVENEDEDADDVKSEKNQLLEVKGSSFFGWGLEPEPIAMFTMIEKTETSMDEEEDDDNYEDVRSTIIEKMESLIHDDDDNDSDNDNNDLFGPTTTNEFE
mmetsp:Transcript_35142/g.51606  ORF Transcript_35142/g.51606 Transcript_35142/m.51606 type:complete len:559 (+) Transcript_35142:56-1732(+)